MEHPLSWHRRLLAVVALAATALVLVLPGRAVGQDDPEARFGLSADVGIDGNSATTWSPLVVTISPEVPVRGRLGVVTESEFGEGGRLVQRRDVEVAAGATEQVRFLVPPGSDQPEVTLQSGDVSSTTRAGAGARGPLVGVLGDEDFADRVGAVTDPLTEQVWTAAVVDQAMLELGPLALEALGSLVADAEVLESLAPPERRALATAVNHQGLHLLVTGATADPGIGRPPGAIVDGAVETVASAWPMVVGVDAVERGSESSPSNAASIRSGRGRVTWLTTAVTDEALRSPRTWGQLWTASPVSGLQPWDRQAPVDPWLVRQQGLRLPSSWGMAAFVVAYLLAAGGVALVVVRRLRRPELAWVVLPGVALVLAGVAFVASSGNDVVGGRALVVATWIDGSGLEEVVALGSFEDAPPLLPGDGWQVASLSWPGVGTEVTAAGVELQGTGDGVGDASVALARRASAVDAPVEVEAARLADGVRVEVANTGGATLSSLRVVADGRIAGDVEDSTLAAGDTVTAVVADPAGGDWSPDALESEPGRFDDVEPGGRDTLAGYVQDLVEAGPELVWVLGLAEQAVPAPQGLGRLDPQVVAVGVTPTVDPGAPAPAAWLVWGGSSGEDAGFQDMGGEGGEQWIRLTPPGPASAASLAVDLPLVDDEECQNWSVSSDMGDQEVRTLCDGDQPECPPDADCMRDGGDWLEICEAEGGCEYWERQGGGPTSFAVWDPEVDGFRPWDEATASEVAADPARLVTPLGDVVVRQCCGVVNRTTVDVTTGGGS